MEPNYDDVFGELEFDGSWVRQIDITFFGCLENVELCVKGDDEYESIFEEQRQTYLQFLECQSEIVSKTEDAIFKYYQKIVDDYRIQFGKSADERMPQVSEKKDLARLLEVCSVIIPMVLRPGEIAIGFLFECSWDPEHGLGVKLRNGKYEVGTQDLLI